jgi:Tol biopolymer transport system component
MTSNRWILGAITCAIGALAQGAQAIGPAEQVSEIHSHRMYEDALSSMRVSDDARWVLRTAADGIQTLFALPSGRPANDHLRGKLDTLEKAAFCGGGMLRLGTYQGRRGWWFQGEGRQQLQPVTMPADASPTCSSNSQQLAYVSAATPTDLWVGDLRSQTRVPLTLPVNRVVFNHSGKQVLALAFQPDNGLSTLFSVSTGNQQVTQLLRDLDAARYAGNAIAVARGDDAVYLPLAGIARPDDAVRQMPSADRWLKLYRWDMKTHVFTLLESTVGEDHDDPVVVGDHLYWVTNSTPKSVAVVPTTGGRVRQILGNQDGYLPNWAPNGTRLAYVPGDYRRVDIPLNHEVNIVAMDTLARAVGNPEPFIYGPNEDFPPAWSPDQRWIAYHSHRSPVPLPYAEAPGATDDMWIRSAEDRSAPEVKVTSNIAQGGWMYWSPDERSLITTAWEVGGTPNFYRLYTLDFDPATGKATNQQKRQLPSEIIEPLVAEYSPSGDEIAIQDRRTPTESALWIMSSDFKRARRLVTYGSDTVTALAWLPDGSGIAYAALDGDLMQIFTIKKNGGSPVRITDRSGNFMHPRVSPNGDWVAMSRMETILTIRRARLN